MCGIFSIIKKNKFLDDDELNNCLNNAMKSLNSRGPDSKGKHIVNNLFLGHTRLSIIDLSSNGNQPMVDDNGNIIIFNGEIYNHKEIKDEITSQTNEQFNSCSDTEVILKGFKHFGNKVFRKLRGPFSILIYNKIENQILFARDTFGMKPMYIFENKDLIVISSDVKSIKNVFKLELSDISEVLFYKYGFIPEPHTQYKNVLSVEPGKLFSISLKSFEKIFCEDFSLENLYSEIIDYNDVKSNDLNLEQFFSETINSHLMSDVPVSLFLSSGFDSSIIASLANQKKISSITIGFENFERDYEIDNAKKISNFFNIKHITKVFSQNDVLNSFKEYISKIDIPSNDGFNVFLVSKVANKFKFKVSLSGAGGDEILGSYPSFNQVPLIYKYKKFIDLIFSSELLTKIFLKFFKGKFNLNKIKSLVKVEKNIAEIYKFKRSLMTNDELYEKFDKTLVDKTLEYDKDLVKIPENLYNHNNMFLIISYLETCFYLRSQLLRDADNFSMKNSLELRTPFVDIVLYKKVLKITMNQRNTKSKYSKLFLPKQISELMALKNKKSFSTNIYELFANDCGFNGDYHECLRFTSEYIFQNGK